MPTPYETVEVDGRDVRVTNPGKVFFPASGITKMDLVRYYLAVTDGILISCRDRPTTLYRWPNGVDAPDDAFYQKRTPTPRPDWVQTATIRFPSGRSADLVVVADGAHIAWAVNLGCIDLNPWPVRACDVDHPDELRIDLDPTPEVPFEHVWRTALVARDVLDEHGIVGYAKTSGKRGMHVFCPIEPRWSFTEVRRAALALAREVERRLPRMATTAWWKEERRGVFVDYNQNARDRTMASAYSVRPVPDGRVSCPLEWDEVEGLDPSIHTVATVPQRAAARPDPWREMPRRRADIGSLLDLAARDEAGGMGDAPWPPHFPKAEREPPRVMPSRRRRPRGAGG